MDFSRDAAVKISRHTTLLGIAVNTVLAGIKMTAGILGNSYALVADAIESISDIFTSAIVLIGVTVAGKPADEDHPYGHGKFEPLAATCVALCLIVAALIIAIASVHEIRTPHHSPAPFTLVVLLGVIVVKESLFRFIQPKGDLLSSSALQADAAHHRSDAITSIAAAIGICVALIGGPGYESADDFAALIATAIIIKNALSLLKPSLHELLDAAPPSHLIAQVREVASTVPGVLGTHNCKVRKVGFDYFVDLDVLCDPEATIREGHNVAHKVGEALHACFPAVTKVHVHIEPIDEYGRFGGKPSPNN